MEPLSKIPTVQDPKAVHDPRDAQVVVVVRRPPVVVVPQKLQEPDRHPLKKIDTVAIFGQPNCCSEIEKGGAEVVVGFFRGREGPLDEPMMPLKVSCAVEQAD